MSKQQLLDVGNIVFGYIMGVTEDNKLRFEVIGPESNIENLIDLTKVATKELQIRLDEYKYRQSQKLALINELSDGLASIQERIMNLSSDKEDKK